MVANEAIWKKLWCLFVITDGLLIICFIDVKHICNIIMLSQRGSMTKLKFVWARGKEIMHLRHQDKKNTVVNRSSVLISIKLKIYSKEIVAKNWLPSMTPGGQFWWLVAVACQFCIHWETNNGRIYLNMHGTCLNTVIRCLNDYRVK